MDDWRHTFDSRWLVKLDFLSILNTHPNDSTCLTDELQECIPFYNMNACLWHHLEGYFKSWSMLIILCTEELYPGNIQKSIFLLEAFEESMVLILPFVGVVIQKL